LLRHLIATPGEFELVFFDAVVEDRKPTPGVIAVEGAVMAFAAAGEPASSRCHAKCEWRTPQRFSSGRDDPAPCAHRRGA